MQQKLLKLLKNENSTMKTDFMHVAVAALILVAVMAVSYYNQTRAALVPPLIDQKVACVNSGGTVTTSYCCKSVNDFPDTCLIGACGCSPANSHSVTACDCGPGKCWDSTQKKCVST